MLFCFQLTHNLIANLLSLEVLYFYIFLFAILDQDTVYPLKITHLILTSCVG